MKVQAINKDDQYFKIKKIFERKKKIYEATIQSEINDEEVKFFVFQ